MRALIISFWLLHLAGHALANLRAGPYQTVWLWYAYRIDGMRKNPEFVLGCHGSGPGGRCLFDEFLQWIDKGKFDSTLAREVQWQGHTSVGNNLDPDVDHTAHELRTSGTAGDPTTRYQNVPSLHKLFPSTFPPVVKNGPKFGVIHGMVMDIVQKARKELGDDHLATQLNAVRKAWSNIHSQRVLDNAENLLKDFQVGLKQRLHIDPQNVPLKNPRPTAPDGTPYDEVDTKAILAGDPNLKLKKVQFVEDFVKKYNTDPGQSSSHFNTIQDCQHFETVLRDPVPC